MHFNLDEILDQAFRWDCKFTIAGGEHLIRPLTVADLVVMQELLQSSDPDRIVKSAQSLFAGEAPDLSRPGSAEAVVTGVIEYFKAHLAKNFPSAVANLVKAAAEKQTATMAGSPSTPR